MKPVDVGVKLVTVRPRVAMLLLVPVMVVVVTSVAVKVWLPSDFKGGAEDAHAVGQGGVGGQHGGCCRCW